MIRGDNIGEQQEKQRESTPASSTDVVSPVDFANSPILLTMTASWSVSQK